MTDTTLDIVAIVAVTSVLIVTLFVELINPSLTQSATFNNQVNAIVEALLLLVSFIVGKNTGATK